MSNSSPSIPRPAHLPLLHHLTLLLELPNGPAPVGLADTGRLQKLGTGMVAGCMTAMSGRRRVILFPGIDGVDMSIS
jgi:hypothetical protein